MVGSRGVMYKAVQAAGASAVVSVVGYPTYLYYTDQGFHRMVQAYSTFVPVVVHYRWMEFLHQYHPVPPEAWEALDEMYAIPTVSKLGQLQGMYTKYGQTAAGFTNTFSDAWIRQLRKLENEVPPRPTHTVFQTIREETSLPVESTFSFWETTPLGSASIGQVHKATLQENGQEVAVKVQYPEAQALFQSDMQAIRKFFEIFAPEHIVLLDALEKHNATELDYRNEANNLAEIQRNMIRDGFQPREVVVPNPLPKFTTQRLLVMELLPGPKLIDGVRGYFAEWAKQNGTTLQELETEARERIEREGIPEKYNGPSARQVSVYRKWLRAKDCFWNIGIDIYNRGFRPSSPLPYQQTPLPPNIPRIIDTLMRVHGTQLLKDGVFNADPHGGNFLLLPDGRLGLIDYGATKRLTRKERLSACLLFAALHRNDEEMLFQMCQIGGYKSKYGRRDVLMKLLQLGYNSYGRDLLGDKNIQQFVDELKAQDPWEEVPDNFVMAQVRYIDVFTSEYPLLL